MLRIVFFTFSLFFITTGSQAHETELVDTEVFSSENAYYDYTQEASSKRNPVGSKWIRIRCAKNSTCYPPKGFKYRNFNVDLRGSDCRGRERRHVKMTKSYIITSRECSLRGSIFIIPTAACRGDYRFCKS